MKNNGQTTENNRDSGALSDPLSFLRSGNFLWTDAALFNHGSEGLYWSVRSSSTQHSYSLRLSNSDLSFEYGASRGNGFAVRPLPNPSPISLILAIL